MPEPDMVCSREQANKVRGQQEADILIETSRQGAGSVLGSKNFRYRLPVSCGLAGRWTMPALPTPSIGQVNSSAQWMHSDSWISEPDSPHFKRPKLFSYTNTRSSTKPLAASNCKSSSSGGSFSSISKIANTEESLGSRDRGKLSSFWYSANERKRSSEQNGIDPMYFKRERSVQGEEGWSFRVAASSRCNNPSLLASDVIGTIDFNEDGKFFATGGIARKIRICSYEKMISQDDERQKSDEDDCSSDEDDDHRRSTSRSRRRSPRARDHAYAAAGEICTPGKLSSLKWRPDGSEVIGCGDYDGVVMEWNIEHRHTVSERYEHSGQRVWSLEYSKVTPTLSASSSADGTVRIWSRGTEKSVSVVRPESGNSICSAEFSPVADHLIAVASADSNVYLYDLRNSDTPLLRLVGHNRAVSYVRFLGKDKLVSASIDSTLKLWDFSASLRDAEADDQRLVVQQPFDHSVVHPVRTYGAHTNVKHFVGLSIHRGAGIFACGSETNEVYLYRDSSPQPLLSLRFPGVSPGYGNQYVGAVCWREHGNQYSLVAANSEGIVQVLEVVH